MADKDYRSQRDKNRETQKSGEPYGHFSAKHIRLQAAKAEAAIQKSQHHGPSSSIKH